MSYAEGTTVPVAKTLEEIRRLLEKAGATHYAYGSAPDREMVQFALAGRHFRFTVARPTAEDLKAAYITMMRRRGHDEWTARRYAGRHNFKDDIDGELKRRWRARLLWLKAQIEFTDDMPLEEAMLAMLVLPDGRTFGDWAVPQIESMYATGGMPPLLGGGS